MGNYAWQCNYCEKPYHLGPCDQPAGVSDETCIAVIRAVLNDPWYGSEGSAAFIPERMERTRTALEAALHPEQAKDGAAG